ncbi:MAG TPA: ATP-binding cassette domain-containing protein [Ktedonobacteraceae bacterium]
MSQRLQDASQEQRGVSREAQASWALGEVVAVQHASVRRGGRTIWQDATFTMKRGEFVTMIGPNGAGKSTLLRAILGLMPLAEGDIRVLGRLPRRGNPALGYVPQRRTLDAHLRVRARDFVSLGIDGQKWGLPLPCISRQHQRFLVQEALNAVEAQGYAERAIGSLSGGEQQRLLLAQALLGDPTVLLLDEPLASLDLRSQQAIAQLTAQVAHERQLAVLLVTHDVNPFLPSTDRLLMIARGQVTIGLPDDLITSERLSQMYDAPVEVLRDSQGRVLVFGLQQTA